VTTKALKRRLSSAGGGTANSPKKQEVKFYRVNATSRRLNQTVKKEGSVARVNRQWGQPARVWVLDLIQVQEIPGPLSSIGGEEGGE